MRCQLSLLRMLLQKVNDSPLSRFLMRRLHLIKACLEWSRPGWILRTKVDNLIILARKIHSVLVWGQWRPLAHQGPLGPFLITFLNNIRVFSRGKFCHVYSRGARQFRGMWLSHERVSQMYAGVILLRVPMRVDHLGQLLDRVFPEERGGRISLRRGFRLWGGLLIWKIWRVGQVVLE